jgi:hypothetical protein
MISTHETPKTEGMYLMDNVEHSNQSSIFLQQIETEIQRRQSTDRRMGYWWVVVPILPVFVIIIAFGAFVSLVVSLLPNVQQLGSGVAGIAGLFSLYLLTFFALYAVLLFGALAFYYLIDRRNRHFKRQQRLFSVIPRYLMAISRSVSSERVARLIELSDDSTFEEVDRPGSLWAILYFFATPIVVFIVAFNLTQDLRKHEERQWAYQQTLPLAFEEAGIALTSFPSPRLHNRDPMVYVVLTAITAGLFWIYWFFTLLRDYNEHFQDQAAFEDQILVTMKPSFKCVACGGSIPQNVKFCPLCGTAQ